MDLLTSITMTLISEVDLCQTQSYIILCVCLCVFSHALSLRLDCLGTDFPILPNLPLKSITLLSYLTV